MAMSSRHAALLELHIILTLQAKPNVVISLWETFAKKVYNSLLKCIRLFTLG